MKTVCYLGTLAVLALGATTAAQATIKTSIVAYDDQPPGPHSIIVDDDGGGPGPHWLSWLLGADDDTPPGGH